MADLAICQNVPDFDLVIRTHLFLSDVYKFGIKKAGDVSAPPDVLYFALY